MDRPNSQIKMKLSYIKTNHRFFGHHQSLTAASTSKASGLTNIRKAASNSVLNVKVKGKQPVAEQNSNSLRFLVGLKTKAHFLFLSCTCLVCKEAKPSPKKAKQPVSHLLVGELVRKIQITVEGTTGKSNYRRTGPRG